MFDIDPITALGIIARTLVIYFVILVGLRLSGKREIGQMTVFDLVMVLFLLANAVQNAMIGPDTSLAGGILAAEPCVVLPLHHLRSPGRVVEPSPSRGSTTSRLAPPIPLLQYQL